MLQRIRGTQDMVDMRAYAALIDAVKQHAATHALAEISTPILEPTELFKRSLGLFTDVVSKEMYTINTSHEQDSRSTEESICIRPEMTASTMRAYFNNNIERAPWRVWAHGPVFRHERPQKGRFRQFHQINFEMIGAAHISHDAEMIAMLDSFLRDRLKLNNFSISLNFLGSPIDREVYKTILRKFLDEQPHLPQKIRERQETNILRIFDLKDEECQKILANAPVLTDYLSETSEKEWQQVRALLDQLGVAYTINPRLVRGLDYYNKTVFEFAGAGLGAQNAIGGGGRYDYLSQTLGEEKIVPSIGAAFGIERLLLSLENNPEFVLPTPPPMTVIAPFAPEQLPVALTLATALRTHNICCEALLDGGSIKSMLRKANKYHATYVILIGEDEQKNGYVTLKHMAASTEEKVDMAQLINHMVMLVHEQKHHED